jgi:hypothetical protein
VGDVDVSRRAFSTATRGVTVRGMMSFSGYTYFTDLSCCMTQPVMTHARELLNQITARCCQTTAAVGRQPGWCSEQDCMRTCHCSDTGWRIITTEEKSISVTTAAAVIAARPRPRLRPLFTSKHPSHDMNSPMPMSTPTRKEPPPPPRECPVYSAGPMPARANEPLHPSTKQAAMHH